MGYVWAEIWTILYGHFIFQRGRFLHKLFILSRVFILMSYFLDEMPTYVQPTGLIFGKMKNIVSIFHSTEKQVHGHFINKL